MQKQRSFLRTVSVRQRWASLARSLRAWMIIARNAIPVLGVFLLGWNAGIVILFYWFDGITTIAALVFSGMVNYLREKGSPVEDNAMANAVVLIFTSAIMIALLGIPYWGALLFLVLAPVFDATVWWRLANDPWLTFALLLVLTGNVLAAFRHGLDALPQSEITRFYRWQLYVMIARITALMLLALLIPAAMVVGLAIALTCMELFPLPTLKFLGAPVGENDLPPNERTGALDAADER